MKHVSKKLLSLLLAVLLLATALPFQALAAEGHTIHVMIADNANEDVLLEKTINGVVNVSAQRLINHMENADKYELVYWYATDATGTAYNELVKDATVDVTEESYYVVFVKSAKEPDPKPAEPTTQKMSLTVYNAKDECIESIANKEIAKADAEAMTENTYACAVKALTAFGSKYKSITEKQFKSFANMSGQIVIVLNVDSTTTDPGHVAEKVRFTVDTGSGTYYMDAYEGELYADVLKGKEPARPGQDFKYWYSNTLKKAVGTSEVINGDTVVAMFGEPIKYSISFIDERGVDKDVVKIKQVAYGSELGTLPTPSERKGYVFMGWKILGKMVTEETVYLWQGSVDAYAVWKLESDTNGEAMNGTHTADGKVYLEVYTNNNTKDRKLLIDITSYAGDNKITRSEVETVVKKRLSAKSGYSLSFVGLFDEEGWWYYTRDPETDGEASIVVNRDGDDYIYVMVNNVKTVTADSSNPKTGDAGIMMPLFALVSSAASAAYVFTKKRH